MSKEQEQNQTQAQELDLSAIQPELFQLVEYSHESAERIGYSNYSYWRSVIRSFLHNIPAVLMSIVFIGLVIASFVALSVAKYRSIGVIAVYFPKK